MASPPGFNPTVVRFELKSGRDPRIAEGVSIPQWCDLNPIPGAPPGKPEQRFNPTVVRFELAHTTVQNRARDGFNPTVVRFELPRSSRAEATAPVSIPQWCDLNQAAPTRFPGSWTVSIPQWCDLNTTGLDSDFDPDQFQSHSGAI